MKTKDMTARQLARKKTLFPLAAVAVARERLVIAAHLRGKGFSFYAIRQVMKISPDEARRLVAKAMRRGLVS
jgi:hypothetical protein